MNDASHLLVAEGLVKTYDQGRVRALAGIDLKVLRGEFVSIVGPSGSGKSTLLHMLGALDRPEAGRIVLDGVDIAQEPRLDRIRARSIGFVFQFHNLLGALTALENVEVPLYALPVSRSERRTQATQLLESVGLRDRVDHLPSQLSGGERQRVAIARALVGDPKLLLADEPTGNLDQASGQKILELIDTVRERRGLTLILVTHDPEVARRADRTLRIVDGLVAQEWTNEAADAPAG